MACSLEEGRAFRFIQFLRDVIKGLGSFSPCLFLTFLNMDFILSLVPSWSQGDCYNSWIGFLQMHIPRAKWKLGGVWDSLLHILYLSRRGIFAGAPSDCGLFPFKGFPLVWLGHLPMSTLGKASIWHIQFFICQ